MFLSQVKVNLRQYLAFQTILFLLWPFGSFLCSLLLIRNKVSRLFFVLFSILAGYQLIYPENFDISRHLEQFKALTSLSFADIFSAEYFLLNRIVDLYGIILFYTVSLFTSNEQVLTACIYFVYSFIFVKFLKRLFEVLPEKVSVVTNIFFIGILFTFPIDNIQAIRFGTSFIFFIYFFVRSILGDKKAHYWLLLTPAIHFSMILPCLLYFVYRYLRVKERICWLIVFIALSGRSVIGLLAGYIQNFSGNNIYSAVFTAYETQKDTFEKGLESYYWYIQYKDLFVAVVLTFIVVIVQKANSSWPMKDHFFRFLLLFLAALLLCSFNPILLVRMRIIFIMLCYLYLFLTSIAWKGYVLTLCGCITVIPILWQIVVNLRQAMEVVPSVLLIPLTYLPFL